MIRVQRSALVALTALLVAGPAIAQTAPRIVDRIVAVVGGRTILASQIEERIILMMAQNQPIPQDSAGRAALERRILDEMVDEEVLVQSAEQDTAVSVTDQEVQGQVEATIKNVRDGFASETDFLMEIQRAGFASADEWRRYLSENQRRSILGQRYVEQLRARGKLRAIPPTDAQVLEFWNAQKNTLPLRPASVSFRQIVVTPKPDEGAKVHAARLADSLATAIRAGADFATLATRFSDDSSTKAAGGELGWFRRGIMVPAFETAVFTMKPGEVSYPVETNFGYHVIRVDRAQPGEVLARHILLAPVISDAQVADARRRADSIYAMIKRGGSAADPAARVHHDPNEPRLVETTPVDSMPAEYRQALAGDTALGVKPVFSLGTGNRRIKFVVLEVTAYLPPGEIKFEDVKNRIRDRLGADLALRHFLNNLRRQAYIDIRL